MTCAALTKAVLHVDGSGGTLEDTESLDDGGGHAVLGLVDVEVAQGPGSQLYISFPCTNTCISYIRRRGSSESSYRWVWAPQYLSAGTWTSQPQR